MNNRSEPRVCHLCVVNPGNNFAAACNLRIGESYCDFQSGIHGMNGGDLK